MRTNASALNPTDHFTDDNDTFCVNLATGETVPVTDSISGIVISTTLRQWMGEDLIEVVYQPTKGGKALRSKPQRLRFAPNHALTVR